MQKAAKATGVIKANGSNVAMIEQLNSWLNSQEAAESPAPVAPEAPELDANAPRSPAASETSSAADAAETPCPSSCLSLGISGLKDSAKRDESSPLVNDLAAAMNGLDCGEDDYYVSPIRSINARVSLGNSENILNSLPTKSKQRPSRRARAAVDARRHHRRETEAVIKPSGPAATWKGSHIRF